MELAILLKIILASFLATSTITILNYSISIYTNKLHQGPLLLTYALLYWDIGTTPKQRTILSWGIHYFMGLIFMFCFHLYCQSNELPADWITMILMSIIFAWIGIFSWITLFKISHFKPQINFADFYVHIFFISIIFTIIVPFLYKII